MIPNKPIFGKIPLDSLAYPLIVVLVGISAFGLGRLSVKNNTNSPLGVHQEAEASTTPASTVY